MSKSVSTPTDVVDLAAYRTRRRDAAIHAVAYDLHLALGDDIDDFDFAYLVDVAAGIAQ